MVAIASVMIIVLISLILTRIATVALIQTGLSRETARFQARSALTGTGFTTSESESIVNHPVRRRLVLSLMLVGSAGVVTVIATLLLSFVNADRAETLTRLAVLIVALAVVLVIARSKRVDALMMALIGRALNRWTDIEARDYSGLLHLGQGYAVNELMLREGDWITDRPLRDLDLRNEGIAVLAIVCPNGTYIGTPERETAPRAKDMLIVYGPTERLQELDRRMAGPKGDRAHEDAVSAQRGRFTEQEAEEKAARRHTEPTGPVERTPDGAPAQG
ncbi:MAG: potassium transporter TrkA [Solirubrobacterales bacterium]